MSFAVIVGVLAVVCLVLFFKIMSFLLKLTVIAVALAVAYWFLAPMLGMPPLVFPWV